jgi:hypothetical protein
MKINDEIKMLIFSKNRAMQLDLCVNSFYLQSKQNPDLPEIDVIYKADPEHKESYNRFQYEHPYVNMIEEVDFRKQVIESLNKKYILFCVDDTIWCNPFDLNDPMRALEIIEYMVGFSFRLGKNTKYCYPFGMKQQLPDLFHNFGKKMIGYIWANQGFDFGYPMEISSSLYRSNNILEILKEYNFKNPNELESLIDFCKIGYFLNPDQNYMSELLCYDYSVAFAAPMNRVQDVALNKFNHDQQYSADNLLKKYNDGYRIDYRKFDGVVPNGAHMEVKYEFYKEQE